MDTCAADGYVGAIVASAEVGALEEYLQSMGMARVGMARVGMENGG